MENKEVVLQGRLGPEREKVYYLFPKGIGIWPENGKGGNLTEELQARKLEGKRVKGLQGWQAEGTIYLRVRDEYRNWPAGTRFGAFTKSEGLRRRTIKG